MENMEVIQAVVSNNDEGTVYWIGDPPMNAEEVRMVTDSNGRWTATIKKIKPL